MARYRLICSFRDFSSLWRYQLTVAAFSYLSLPPCSVEASISGFIRPCGGEILGIESYEVDTLSDAQFLEADALSDAPVLLQLRDVPKQPTMQSLVRPGKSKWHLAFGDSAARPKTFWELFPKPVTAASKVSRARAKAGGDDTDALSRIVSTASYVLLHTRKAGPHQDGRQTWSPRMQPSVKTRLGPPMLFGKMDSFFRSASAMDWYFFCIIIAFNLAMDIFILQQLPETERTNFALLIFWLLVAMTFGAEIWLRLGVTAAAEWATGYGMEVLFSIDTIFVNHILLATLEVPRRLLAKVMLLGLAGSIFFRLMLYSGLASVLNSFYLLPACTGLVLVYCGAKCMTVPYGDGEEDWPDVMHAKPVQWARAILGKRLCEFYDEDGESLLMVSNGKLCVTLLGVVVACQLVANSLLCLDVVFAKVDEIPNAYLNFTSSVVALFTVRALFFVARDIFSRFELTNAGSGFVIFFVGVELVVARAVYVSAAASFVAIVVIAVISIIFSRMLQPSFVKAGARLPCSLTC